MVSHAVWKTWPSGLRNDKNLGLQPRFLSTGSLGPCFHMARETMIKSYNICPVKSRLKLLMHSLYSTVEVWTWINNLIPHFTTDVLIHVGLKLNDVGKGAPGLNVLTIVTHKVSSQISEIGEINTRKWPCWRHFKGTDVTALTMVMQLLRTEITYIR